MKKVVRLAKYPKRVGLFLIALTATLAFLVLLTNARAHAAIDESANAIATSSSSAGFKHATFGIANHSFSRSLPPEATSGPHIYLSEPRHLSVTHVGKTSAISVFDQEQARPLAEG